MEIGRLNETEQLRNIQSRKLVMPKIDNADIADTINLSDEARELAEAYYVNQIAAQTPDVREDRIAAVKERLKDPNYINDAVVGLVADRIIDVYGI